MPAHDLIVLGTSMGGVEALIRIVKRLPADLPATLLIVEHFPPNCQSRLPEILAHAGPLPASHARDGEAILPGHIYIAPPDYHLIVEGGRLRLDHGGRENRFRPSIDPLFRSAARQYDGRTIGVLLTGGAGDGVAGLIAVRHAGGVAIVQDPADAYAAAMPRSAIQIAGADHIVPLADIPGLLIELVGQRTVGGKAMNADPIEQMPKIVGKDMHAQENGERQGMPSVYICPECGGLLWQVDQDEMVRFRCHVGHAYYAEQLLEGQAETLEAALWMAVRIFRERAVLARQLANKERDLGHADAAARHDEQAELAERHGKSIQENLLNAKTGLFR
jgi:two-component system chemotaxis response regulator CheB